MIAGWIAAGMPAPKEADPRIQELEVLPRAASLLPGAKQQILVRARFSDGHTEDVTRWAKYAGTDESVASVDQGGLVTMNGHGEAPVTVWYLDLVAAARLTVPFSNELKESVFRQAPRRNYIDDLVLKKLQQLHIPPSPPASDAEFIRRAYLDAAGILPTADETEAFPGRLFAGQADAADRRFDVPAGVRGLLGLSLVGPSTGFEPAALARRHVELLPLDSRLGSRQQAMGSICARGRNRLRDRY